MVNRLPSDTPPANFEQVGAETPRKTYAVALTHDEIHLVFWAITVADAARNRNELEVVAAQGVYERVHGDFTDAALDNFVEKFDAMHAVARIDDGE